MNMIGLCAKQIKWQNIEFQTDARMLVYQDLQFLYTSFFFFFLLLCSMKYAMHHTIFKNFMFILFVVRKV